MIEGSRFDVLPEEHILNMFNATADGKVTVTCDPHNGEGPYDRTYEVEWKRRDAEYLALGCRDLTSTLRKLGMMVAELEDGDKRRAVLDESELEIWDIFLSPFEPFEVEHSVIMELQLRGEYDELSEEENGLLERYYVWLEEQCRKRLPYMNNSPENYIIRARRYAKLIAMGAPEIVVMEEGRCLAEEMVIYYYGKQGGEINGA